MSKKTLNKTNLQALGAARLAELLIEVSTGSAEIKRRLRLELSHNLGVSDLAGEVRKRLVALRKARGFVSWRKRKALVKDLRTQADMILDKIAPEDPAAGFDLLWQFIELAPGTYERVDDSRGEVGDVFRAALLQIGDIGRRAHPDPLVLADRVWNAVQDNGYGEWDGLIALVAPSLGRPGLDRLRALVEAYAAAPLDPEEEDLHDAILMLRELRGQGRNYAAERKARFVKSCLQEIAAAAGDTSAYIAQYSDTDLKRKDIAAEVAGLYLAEGQPQKALDLLQGVEHGGRNYGQQVWDDAYIASLLALGQHAAAQSHRWTCFTDRLSLDHLRAYLKDLPDFEDVEAEDRARSHLLAFAQPHAALAFCLEWPDLHSAATLVETRFAEIDGDHYELLTPAAEALRTRAPRAAVLLWRAMINFALHAGRSSRYGHAADHLADCARADAEIPDYGPFPDHDAYVAGLRRQHDRKSSFWSRVG